MDKNFSHAECNGIPSRFSYQKLKLPHRKTNQGLKTLSYIRPSLWNNQDKSLKTPASLNTFKHNIKDYYYQKGNKQIHNNNSTTNHLFIVSRSPLNSLPYF